MCIMKEASLVKGIASLLCLMCLSHTNEIKARNRESSNVYEHITFNNKNRMNITKRSLLIFYHNWAKLLYLLPIIQYEQRLYLKICFVRTMCLPDCSVKFYGTYINTSATHASVDHTALNCQGHTNCIMFKWRRV